MVVTKNGNGPISRASKKAQIWFTPDGKLGTGVGWKRKLGERPLTSRHPPLKIVDGFSTSFSL
jgi:hypothetical protein